MKTYWRSLAQIEDRPEYRAALDGVLAARHFPGLVKTGDCLAVIATVED